MVPPWGGDLRYKPSAEPTRCRSLFQATRARWARTRDYRPVLPAIDVPALLLFGGRSMVEEAAKFNAAVDQFASAH